MTRKQLYSNPDNLKDIIIASISWELERALFFREFFLIKTRISFKAAKYCCCFNKNSNENPESKRGREDFAEGLRFSE